MDWDSARRVLYLVPAISNPLTWRVLGLENPAINLRASAEDTLKPGEVAQVAPLCPIRAPLATQPVPTKEESTYDCQDIFADV